VRYRRSAYNAAFPKSWTTPTGWQDLTSTKVSAAVAAGYTYCFEVRGTDNLGNVARWSKPLCVARALDDRALNATSGWTRGKGSAYYLGTYLSTSRKAAALTKDSVRLDRVGIVATTCSSCGVVGVYVGNRLMGRVNLHSRSTKNKVIIVLPKFSLRRGTVAVKVLSSGKKVMIDGLAVSQS
jgi:hypothetical protein